MRLVKIRGVILNHLESSRLTVGARRRGDDLPERTGSERVEHSVRRTLIRHVFVIPRMVPFVMVPSRRGVRRRPDALAELFAGAND